MDLPVSSVSTQHPWFRDGEADVFVTATEGSVAYNQPNFHKFLNDNTTKYSSARRSSTRILIQRWLLRYLGYPTAANPVLNWSSERVKSTIHDAIKKFLLLGVDGFHIDHVSQLAVDELGKPDVSSLFWQKEANSLEDVGKRKEVEPSGQKELTPCRFFRTLNRCKR